MKKILLMMAFLFGLLNAYSQAGTLDSSFAGKGWTFADFSIGNSYSEFGQQALVQNDGSYIVVVNFSGGTVLTRYYANGNQDKSYGTDGFSEPVLISKARAALQKDGKVVLAGGALLSAGISGDAFALTRYNKDGSVDYNFGDRGRVITDFGNNGVATSLALQSDGKIVVAGYTFRIDFFGDFILARYNPNGSLDNSFGMNGKVITDFGNIDGASSMAIQSDGKIIVAGYTLLRENFSNFALARYNSDGSLDSSFDSDGKTITSFGNNSRATSLALQSNGKIVVAGYTSTGSFSEDFALARYIPNGTLDSSFGINGKVVTDFGNMDAAFSIAIQSDGKIIAAGSTDDKSTSTTVFALARYNPDGSLDDNSDGSSFDGDGKTIISTNSFTAAYSVAIQNDGKIVATGVAYEIDSDDDIAVARLNPDGSLDNSFDGDGLLTGYYEVGSSTIYTMALQCDGKIIIAGTSGRNRTLIRYNPDGSFDKNFGTNGKVISDFVRGFIASSLAIQNDGKVVVAGSTDGSKDFALARYNSDGSLDSSFGLNGEVITDFGSIDIQRDDYATSLALQNDGKIIVAGYTAGTHTTEFALARYNPDGSLDDNADGNSFDGDGKAVSNFGGDSWARSMAIQRDGKIIVSGIVSMNNSFNLVRFNSDGSLDRSFGSGGVLSTHFPGGINMETSFAVAIQNDGKIVVVGASDVSFLHSNFAIVRYNPDYTLDNSFDWDGFVTTDFSGYNDYAYSVAIQSNGKIVVGGWMDERRIGKPVAVLARYNANGSLDYRFGTEGKLIPDFLGLYHLGSYPFCAIKNNRLYVGGVIDDMFTRGVVAAYKVESFYYQDSDGDGYGNAARRVEAFSQPNGYVLDNTDCDDTKAAVHPDAIEVCSNGIDDNCNGQVDEGSILPEISSVRVSATTPVVISATINLAVSFADTKWTRVFINWGDGSTTIWNKEDGSTIPDLSQLSHTYQQAGVYQVSMTLTNTCGEATAPAETYVVVYDPTGGFVTGNGWFHSPAGAYKDEPTLTGQAYFGFESRSVRGNTVPQGMTSFKFKLGNLHFSSTSYNNTRLLLAGARASYKGKGTINGAGDYDFSVLAVDGDIPGGGGADKFYIKIWDQATGKVVYDNNLTNADENANAATPIGGGAIIISDSKGKPALSIPKGANEQEEMPSAAKLSLLVYPNPAPSNFSITAQGSNEAPVIINIRDAAGRIIDTQAGVAPWHTVQMGRNCRPGIYYIEAKQGSERAVVKVVKTNE